MTLAHVLWARRIGADTRYQLQPAARQVLITLATYASRTGAAWPSSTMLAGETGLHEVTVRKALALIGDLRDPETHRRLFAAVDRQPGRYTIFQFPTPGQAVAQDYGSAGLTLRVPVTAPVAQAPAAQLIGSAEVPAVTPEPDADGSSYDPDHVKGFCPDCGHHWIHHSGHGCRWLCDCRTPRPL